MSIKKVMKKNFSTDNLRIELNKTKYANKVIGLCHGVFDLLHLGHIKHFEEAKKNCDILIVSITSNRFVFKGPGRPKFDQNERMEALAALQVVDFVILSDFISAEQNIAQIKPKVYFKGPDYKNNAEDLTGKIIKENKILKKFGGSIIYTKSKNYSSSKILNETYNSKKSKDILRDIVKRNFNFNKIKKLIQDLSSLKPLVIGEIIVDEYNFCEALGKSGKEPMLVIRDLFKEQYLGGSGAICNNLSEFCNNVSLLSYVGEKSENLNFINKKLKKNILFKYIKKSNSTTILKKRFIDDIIKSKILGLYSLNDAPLNKKEEHELTKNFINLNKKTNMTIISDYGHGLISKNFINKVKKASRFIAVNSQINSANIGHHSLNYYNNVDLMTINEKELRHEMRSKDEKVSSLMKRLSKNLKINYLVVTRGSSGCVLFDRKKIKFYYSKAYTSKTLDKIGAGDTMLSILSICIFNKIDLNLSLLISSLCAVQSVNTIGNKVSINESLLLKDLDYFLI